MDSIKEKHFRIEGWYFIRKSRESDIQVQGKVYYRIGQLILEGT